MIGARPKVAAKRRWWGAKTVHWSRKDLVALSTEQRLAGYQCEFKGIRIVPGLYIGLFNGRRKRLHG